MTKSSVTTERRWVVKMRSAEEMARSIRDMRSWLVQDIHDAKALARGSSYDEDMVIADAEVSEAEMVLSYLDNKFPDEM